MSRISCDVTKDLLPSYLDEICSAESKELVDEHLLECPSCRRFMAELQVRDQGKDAPEVNFLRRVRRFMDIQSWTWVLCSLVLMMVGFYVADRTGGRIFFYVAMPLLMLGCFFMTREGEGTLRPEKKEWMLPLLTVLLALGATGLPYGFFAHLRKLLELESQYGDGATVGLGPLTHCVNVVTALAAVVLLAMLIVHARKKGRVFPVSMNLACLTMVMVLTFDRILYMMSDMKSLWAYWNENLLILWAEFVIVTALLAVLRRCGGVKKARP